jgi:hypothetical protein
MCAIYIVYGIGDPFSPSHSARRTTFMLSPRNFTGLFIIALTVFCAGRVAAQWDKRPYREWSEKEARAVLDNSPWGQTQTIADTSHMFDTGRAVLSNERREAEVPETKFHIRLFSAKPVRQATGRLIEIQRKGEIGKQLAAQLEGLANADFPDYIIVTVVMEVAKSGSQMGAAASLLDRQTTSQLKPDTYLSLKGKRLFLAEYQPPRPDGLGARFVFPRLVDGKPFISEADGELVFHSSLNSGPELSTRFKVKDMTFNGKLEY